ncbi:hypothetical protein FPSE_06221 [Fusarium pseudograminearum CS3096]|uniref:Uncharacterized protein n=1 Tax=Fusarium pseudograminearum (strain CS3096) TaxID=1028729 RepID=K3VJW0_FUSPC|nr:hypothetical protein FPSE_06221 [Fusarium pseudograminearum CS3096]EKJ73603.1 hypothetical protein FPSE_06221 [Fusarium pseudograminearum CS3096]
MVTTRSMRSNTLAMEIDNDGSDYEMHETNDENDKSFIEDQGQDEDQDEGENFIGDDDEDGDENDDGDEYDDEDDRDEYNDQDDEDEYDDEDGDKDEDKHIGEDEGYNDCNAQQPCQKVFKDRESLLKHVRACAACPLKYKQHEDCARSPEKYSDWSLNTHNGLGHDDISMECPFPPCRFRTQTRERLLRHLSMPHGILSNSVPSLLQFNSMEVYGYEDTKDSGITYINVAQHLVNITYPDVSDDLQGLCEVSPWGPRRSSTPSSSYIYGKLLAHADFMKEEDIWPYNLHRLALKPNYNGFIRYREEMVDRSAVLTPVRTAVETTLNRASTATIRQPQEALEFLSDPQRSYGGMSTEETA